MDDLIETAGLGDKHASLVVQDEELISPALTFDQQWAGASAALNGTS